MVLSSSKIGNSHKDYASGNPQSWQNKKGNDKSTDQGLCQSLLLVYMEVGTEYSDWQKSFFSNFSVAPLGERDQFWNWSILWNGILQLPDFF